MVNGEMTAAARALSFSIADEQLASH